MDLLLLSAKLHLSSGSEEATAVLTASLELQAFVLLHSEFGACRLAGWSLAYI